MFCGGGRTLNLLLTVVQKCVRLICSGEGTQVNLGYEKQAQRCTYTVLWHAYNCICSTLVKHGVTNTFQGLPRLRMRVFVLVGGVTLCDSRFGVFEHLGGNAARASTSSITPITAHSTMLKPRVVYIFYVLPPPPAAVVSWRRRVRI